MFDKKEVTAILICSIFLGFALSFFDFLSAAVGAVLGYVYFQIFLTMTVAIFLVLLINSLAKKVAAYFFDSDLKIRIWEVKRWGYKPSHYFKTPILAGVFVPLLTSVVSTGYFIWLAPLVFDVTPSKHRVAKRHGQRTYYRMNESHIGLIAAFGLLANVFFAFIGYTIGFNEFANLSLLFVLFNMIPISDLDGTKIIFGNKVLWFVMLIISLSSFFIGAMLF